MTLHCHKEIDGINQLLFPYGRERKIYIQGNDGMTVAGSVSWSTYAQNGLWKKDRVRLEGYDGALLVLTRDQIGSGEDLTLS